MEVKATASYIKISPRKVRLVTALVRGKTVAAALDQLRFVGKLAATPVRKVIASAVANAKHNYELSEDNLFIKEIRVDQAGTLSRWMPRAHGRATPLRKRMSHIKVTIAEVTDSGARTARNVAVEAPVKLGNAPAKDEGIKTEEKAAGKPKENLEEKDKRIVDPRREGRSKGFTSKIFNRKAG